MVERDKRINVNASDEERAMLRALAERAGITGSDWIRMAIRKAFADISATTPRP